MRPETARLQAKLEDRLIDLMDNPEHRPFFARRVLSIAFRAGYYAGSGVTLQMMLEDGWREPPPWKRNAD